MRNVVPAKQSCLGHGVSSKDLSIIIPIAGIGRRMKLYGPKSLFQVDDTKTLLDYQLQLLFNTFPQCEITLVTGFQHDKIYQYVRESNYSVKIVQNTRYEETNVAYSIALGMQVCVSDYVLVIYGDLFLKAESIKNIVKSDSCKILIEDKTPYNKNNVGVVQNGNNITNMSHGLNDIWSQIFYLDKSYRNFEQKSVTRKRDRWFSYEVLNEMIDEGLHIESIKNTSNIIEIDNIKDLERVK